MKQLMRCRRKRRQRICIEQSLLGSSVHHMSTVTVLRANLAAMQGASQLAPSLRFLRRRGDASCSVEGWLPPTLAREDVTLANITAYTSGVRNLGAIDTFTGTTAPATGLERGLDVEALVCVSSPGQQSFGHKAPQFWAHIRLQS